MRFGAQRTGQLRKWLRHLMSKGGFAKVAQGLLEWHMPVTSTKHISCCSELMMRIFQNGQEEHFSLQICCAALFGMRSPWQLKEVTDFSPPSLRRDLAELLGPLNLLIYSIRRR